MQCSCFDNGGTNCIKMVPIFNNLTEEEMLEIAAITRDRTFEKGEMVYKAGDEGEKLYVIHTGKVKITRFTESGKEQVIRVLGPGEFMGELSLFSAEPMQDYGEVIEKANMCVIDGNKLKKLMGKYPSITFKVMEELSKRLDKAENLIENINHYSVEKRLSQALLELSNGNGVINLEMSKKDLASNIGMSQETLSRKLSAFQEEGIIDLKGHRKIIILNIDALEEIN